MLTLSSTPGTTLAGSHVSATDCELERRAGKEDGKEGVRSTTYVDSMLTVYRRRCGVGGTWDMRKAGEREERGGWERWEMEREKGKMGEEGG